MKTLHPDTRRRALAAVLVTTAAFSLGSYLPTAEARELGEGLRGSDRLLELGDDRGRGREWGDDRGRGRELGDDRGRRGRELGDDRGRRREPGDDRGGRRLRLFDDSRRD